MFDKILFFFGQRHRHGKAEVSVDVACLIRTVCVALAAVEDWPGTGTMTRAGGLLL